MLCSVCENKYVCMYVTNFEVKLRKGIRVGRSLEGCSTKLTAVYWILHIESNLDKFDRCFQIEIKCFRIRTVLTVALFVCVFGHYVSS